MMKSDDGLSPVIAIAMLIGMVVLAGAIIGLSMFSALESASGAAPDVQFRISGDNKSLYHAGGDVLYKKDLMFYDTAKFASGMDSAAANVTGFVRVNEKQDWNVWQTGDVLTLTAGSLSVLSIVGRDSRGHPVLLYLGSDAKVLPLGDVVPDVWGDVGGDTPGPEWPPYVFDKNASWKSLLDNIENLDPKKPNESTVYFEEKSGMYYFAYSLGSGGDITSETSLENYANNNNDMLPMNFSDVREKSGIVNTTDGGYTWNNGDTNTEKGTLYVDETGILYIWTSADTPLAAGKLPPDGWTQIGKKSS